MSGLTMPQNRPWQVAEDLRSGRRVLVTSIVMPEEESHAGGFVEQAAGLVELSTVHDRIARILDYGRDNGMGFIVLEYPEGERLGDLLHREGPLDVRRSLRFGVQIAGVLEAVHLRGAAHGRLTVDDVLVVGYGVKVGGLERTLVEQYASEPRPRWTDSCNADESVAARQRADITALAALLYFMTTNIDPSKGSRRLIPLRRMQRNVPVSVERMIMNVLGDRRGKVQYNLSDILNVLWLAAMNCERRSSQRVWGGLGTMPAATSVLAGTLGTIVTIVVIWSLTRDPVASSLPRGPSPHMVSAGASATPTLSGTSSWTLPPVPPTEDSALTSDYPAWERDRESLGRMSDTAESESSSLGGLRAAKQREPSALPKGPPAPRSTRRNVVSQNVVSGESRTPALSAPARSPGAEAPASPIPAPPLRPQPGSIPSAIKQAVAAPEESHPDPTAIIDWLLREGTTRQ
jgi:hypothetical protein